MNRNIGQPESKIEIKQVKFNDLCAESAWQSMIEEYSDESRIVGMPYPECQNDMYVSMEQHGAFRCIAAYCDGELAGFCHLLISVLPHYGRVVATTESIFVRSKYRAYGVGLALIRWIERYSKNEEAIALLFSAPKGGRMEQLMPSLGYTNTNVVFFKAFA